MDLSNAHLEPFRGFHEFHEEVNLYLKVTLSAALLLVRHASGSEEGGQLGQLIRLTHPSWSTPPVREMSLELQRGTYSWISSFPLVAIFSAFDDLIDGTAAEMSRFNSFRQRGKEKRSTTRHAATTTAPPPATADDASPERILRLYKGYTWDTSTIEPWLPLIRYFRLCRNCIAHRNGRASQALVHQCEDPEVHRIVSERLHLDRASSELRRYALNERIYVEPTQALLCSHTLREIARDANEKLLRALGLDGFLNAVAHHSMLGDECALPGTYASAQSALNGALTKRYRAKLIDRHEATREMKRIGLWDRYLRRFASRVSKL